MELFQGEHRGVRHGQGGQQHPYVPLHTPSWAPSACLPTTAGCSLNQE